MANIQIKRYDSGWVDLFPKTTAGNIISGTLDAARIPNLSATKITSDTFDAARIPNLDASKITTGTISAARLPSSVIGGMRFTGTTGGSVSIDDITGTGLNELNAKGQYLICTSGTSLTQGSTVTGTVQAPGDEGDSTLPIGLESGDWIIALSGLGIDSDHASLATSRHQYVMDHLVGGLFERHACVFHPRTDVTGYLPTNKVLPMPRCRHSTTTIIGVGASAD